MIPVDVADADAVFAAAERVEAELRPDRRLGERRVHVGVRAVLRRSRPRSTAASPRSATSATCYATMAALKHMKPRDRGTIVQVGSALAYRGIPLQIGLLRRQTRHPGLPRGAALRAAAREEQRARHDGADAGGQHPAVLLGAVPAASPRPTGAADLPARVRRPRAWCTPPSTPVDASTGSAPARSRRSPPTRSPPVCWIATSDAPGSHPSRRAAARSGRTGQSVGSG